MLFDRTHRTIDQPVEQGRIAGRSRLANGMPRVQPPHGHHCICHLCARRRTGAYAVR